MHQRPDPQDLLAAVSLFLREQALLQHDGSLAELNERLCDCIADGRIGFATPGLAAHLWQSTLGKLAVDQPAHASDRRSLAEGAAR